MSIVYRTAGETDAEALVALFHRCFIDTFGHLYDPADLGAFLEEHTPNHWVEQLRDPAFAVRVAEDDGRMVGFVKLGPVKLPAEADIELRQLYVAKDALGSGIGPVLMDWAADQARARGAGTMVLSVWTENHRAKRFYARYGFEEVGPYAFMVGNQADEDIIMRAAL